MSLILRDCPGCGELRLTTSFYDRHPVCKDCVSARRKADYQKSDSKFRRYSEADDEFLRTEGSQYTLIELSEIMDRSEASIAKRFTRLGISGQFKRKSIQRDDMWNAEELDMLFNPEISYAEIARVTGRSLPAVRGQAFYRGVSNIRDYHLRGEAHARWRGGSSEQRMDRGEDWPLVRLAALERDGYACQDCEYYAPSAAGLQVHHMIPWRLLASNDLAWLVTLCASCHHKRPEHMWVTIPDDVAVLRFAGSTK